jgi:UDP-N-acetylmuramate--alanine ligase
MSPDLLARIVRDLARPGDMVVCLGAGNITSWAAALPGELATLYGETPAGGAA